MPLQPRVKYRAVGLTQRFAVNKRMILICFLFALCCDLSLIALVGLLPISVSGFSSYRSLIPNGNNVFRNGVKWVGVGHYATAGGGPRNPFGLDFADMGKSWSLPLCQSDSDGDGFTNGMELGDPDCVWSVGKTPSRTVNITHPGFADSFPAVASGNATPAQGPLTTVMPPPPPTPSPPLVTTQYGVTGAPIARSTSDVSLLNGAGQLQWRVYRPLNNASDIIEFDLTSQLGSYLGVGVASVGMNGPVLVCYVDTTTVIAQVPIGVCRTGRGLSFSAVFDLIVRADVRGFNVTKNSWTLTVRISASTFGIGDNGAQRFIAARGAYDMASNTPQAHRVEVAYRGSIGIDIYAGSAHSTDQSTWKTLAIAIVVAVCALWLMIVAASNAVGLVLRPTSHRAARFVLGLVFCGMVALYVWATYQDASSNLKSSPLGRAFGNGAVFCFWFVMYPVPKHVGLATVAGTSFERIIAYHELVGTLLTVFVTVHMAMMINVTPYASDVIFSWRGTQPYVAGMVAWMCLVVVVLTGWLLRNFVYWMFRAAHLLGIPAMVFGIMHHPPLGYALIPPLLNLLVDWITRYAKHRYASARVQSAKHSAAGIFTHVVIELRVGTPWPTPGAFALVGLPGVGLAALPHPLTIAWFDQASCEAHVLIRNMGAETWSEEIADLLTCEGRHAMDGKRAVWLGPYGRLQVPLGYTPHIALIAGGIGITACLSVLQHATMREEYRNEIQHVMLLWTLREPELFEEVLPLIACCRKALSGSRTLMTVRVFMTSPRGAQAVSHFRKQYPFIEFCTRRVAVEADVTDTIKNHRQSPHTHRSTSFPIERGVRVIEVDEKHAAANQRDDTDDDSGSGDASHRVEWTESPPLTVYSCGPRGLNAAARSFAASRDQTYLHVESFEYGR